MVEWVYPSEVRFIHSSIAKRFRNGKYLDDVIRDLCGKGIDVSEFPTIQVVKIDGKLFSFANRRLYVFRVAFCRGAIDKIPIQVVPKSRLDWKKFTTTDDGRTVNVRRGITQTHCKSSWLHSETPTKAPPGFVASTTDQGWELEEMLACLEDLSFNSPDEDDYTYWDDENDPYDFDQNDFDEYDYDPDPSDYYDDYRPYFDEDHDLDLYD